MQYGLELQLCICIAIAHLEDFLNNISVIVTNITGVHFGMVVAGCES